MQNNNPKHFLSEEEFVQLRLELSKSSLAAMVSESDETPAAPAEELPPGTEDLSDPAKVNTRLQILHGKHIFQSSACRGEQELACSPC